MTANMAYIARHRDSMLEMLAELEREPIDPETHAAQLGRALTVLFAVEIILEMGEDALNIDRYKYEAAREAVFTNYRQFRAVARQVRAQREPRPFQPVELKKPQPFKDMRRP